MPERPGPVPTIISVFRRAAALMIDDLVARLGAAGFTGLTPAHSAVFENLDPGGTRLTDLAARARITRQSMSELVSVLEQRGYLERQPDPADRRARIVRLTRRPAAGPPGHQGDRRDRGRMAQPARLRRPHRRYRRRPHPRTRHRQPKPQRGTPGMTQPYRPDLRHQPRRAPNRGFRA